MLGILAELVLGRRIEVSAVDYYGTFDSDCCFIVVVVYCLMKDY